jgi:hypothetical protein
VFSSSYIKLDFTVSQCTVCKEFSIWENRSGLQLYPQKSPEIPLPNKDMEENIVVDYNEAASIFNLSPRGACALLRLALQKLLKQMWEDGKSIAGNLKSLEWKQVLPKTILQAIDVTRYFWNESVHPWELNMNDTPELAKILFTLINKIAEYGISWPKDLTELHSLIPEEKRQV